MTWHNGWTEAKASDFCHKQILETPTGQKCSQFENVDYDSSVEGCVEDIRVAYFQTELCYKDKRTL